MPAKKKPPSADELAAQARAAAKQSTVEGEGLDTLSDEDNEDPNAWIRDYKSGDTMVVSEINKPMYTDANHKWPALEQGNLTGAAAFCEWLNNDDGTTIGVNFVYDEYVKGLHFNEPNDVAVPESGVFAKAIKPDGSYTQIEFSAYINSGSTGNRMGPIYHARQMGFHVYWDDQKMNTNLFCLAYCCFAKAMTRELVKKYPEHSNAIGSGYCSLAHAIKAEPRKFDRGLSASQLAMANDVAAAVFVD